MDGDLKLIYDEIIFVRRDVNAVKDDVGDMKGEIGGLNQAAVNHTAYITAVSAKADRIAKAQSDHEKDQEAHGAGGERRSSGNIVAWLGFGISAAGLLMVLWKHA